MKRLLLTLLVVVLVLGAIAAVGFTGYRLGYKRGAQSVQALNDELLRPQLGPFDNFRSRDFPRRDFGFDREFHRGFGMRGFPMRGFGLFGPLMFLGWIVVLGLIVGFLYWLLARSGWHLTRTTQTTVSQETPSETRVAEVKEEKQPSED